MIFFLLKEKELAGKYPEAYNYLLSVKEELISRDKGKIDSSKWYGYGRSQGLDNTNKHKIFFKTFNNKPKFYSIEEDCLFANGYCFGFTTQKQLKSVFNNIDIGELDFYIKSTSYAIDGGFYCYQKKYLENFAI